MKILIRETARDDLTAGYYFYEDQQPGVGDYFLSSLFADIDSLLLYAGIHRMVRGKHRMLSKTFPFAIYYTLVGDNVEVAAILDLRRRPSWIRQQLGRK